MTGPATPLDDPSPEWFARDALVVARDLLGAHLRVTGQEGAVVVRLTEVEAYRGEADPGSHAFRGRTGRNAAMFAPGGHLYVYFTYGMHWCANLVCGPVGQASAVLLRAGEAIEGLDLARSRRPAATRDVDLARGPARLAAALGLSTADDGAPVGPQHRVRLRVPRVAALPVATGPRVGVAGAGGTGAYPWRFWLPGEPSVSVYRPAKARTRRTGDAGTAAQGHERGTAH